MPQLQPGPRTTGPPETPPSPGTYLCVGGRRPWAGPPQQANISDTPDEHRLRAGVERNESVLRAADVIRFGLPAQGSNEAAEKEWEHEMEGGRREGGLMALGFFLFFFSPQTTL